MLCFYQIEEKQRKKLEEERKQKEEEAKEVFLPSKNQPRYHVPVPLALHYLLLSRKESVSDDVTEVIVITKC